MLAIATVLAGCGGNSVNSSGGNSQGEFSLIAEIEDTKLAQFHKNPHTLFGTCSECDLNLATVNVISNDINKLFGGTPIIRSRNSVSMLDVVVGGYRGNARIIKLSHVELGAFVGHYEDSFLILTRGTEFTGVPIVHRIGEPTGEITFRYSGESSFSRRSGYTTTSSTFSMVVNFDAGTASLSAPTKMSRLVSDSIVINMNDGTFSDKNAQFTDLENDPLQRTPMRAEVYGTFHGTNAGGVSGIYLSEFRQNLGPMVGGTFIGTLVQD